MAKKQSGGKFEKALSELEKVVTALEDDEGLDLDAAINLYAKGAAAAEICGKELDQAEQKIKKLVKDSAGTLREETFGGEE